MRPIGHHQHHGDAKTDMNISSQRQLARTNRHSYHQQSHGNRSPTTQPTPILPRPASFCPTSSSYQQPVDISQRKIASHGNSGSDQPAGAINQSLRQKASRQHIPLALANMLNQLRYYHILLIINDNDSMAQSDPGLAVPEQRQQQELTRFEWLKMRLTSVIPLMASVADQGLTIRALNQQEMVIDRDLPPRQKELHLSHYLEQLKPGGNTSLLDTLRDKFDQATLKGTPTTTYVLTDGDKGACGFLSSQMAAFGLLNKFRTQARGNFFPMSIMACTSDQSELACMNIIGRSVDHLRISNDFLHDAAEAMNTHGPINFSPGIHNVAFLLGAIEPLFNKLDVNIPLTIEELAMLSDREISEREYEGYLNGRSRISSRSICLPAAPWPGEQPPLRKAHRHANGPCNIC